MQRLNLKDPVCGMAVTEKSFYHVEHQGQTHYFCGAGCKRRFESSGGLRRANTGGVNAGAQTGTTAWSGLGWRAGWLLALLAALLAAGRWLYNP